MPDWSVRLDNSKTLEQLLRPLLVSADHETKIRSYYDLGMVLDSQKRYDEAMTAFQEAKSLLRAEAQPLIAPFQAFRARLAKMQSSVSAEMFQRWFDSAPTLQPPRRLALLCGHPRSGTTLLEQVLDSHPNIISVEETKYFHHLASRNPLARRMNAAPLMLEVLRIRANHRTPAVAGKLFFHRSRHILEIRSTADC